MEFGVAAFGAVLNIALSKLCSVKEKKVKTDATLIKNKLRFIEAAMKDYGGMDRDLSFVQIEMIAQLRRLAYDIEDRIDCFHANKTTPENFEEQIRDLKVRSEEMRSEIITLKAQHSIMMWPEQEKAVFRTPIASHDHPDCLLYLCLFPPNHDVRTKPLIRRWVAEGLVQGEKFAEENLGIFIDDSSIIKSISVQRSNNGKVKRCQPTDVMLQCITQRSSSEDFILVCDGTVQLQARDARRLSVHPSANGELVLPEDLSCLRTLAVFPAGATSPDRYGTVLNFSRYGVLRVLDLKECAHVSENHLTDICHQVLMKYLSINLGSITRDIGMLDQLQTLDLSGSEIVTVFKEVLLLPKLKHLFGKLQLSNADNSMLAWRLKKFLRDKSVLETLAGFVTTGRLGFPQLMSRMRMLRKVKIWCKSNASQSNLSAISRAITKFIREGTYDLNRSLSINFQECSGEFLNTISSDAGSGTLSSLKLRGELSRFPEFVEQLGSIVELCLWSTGRTWMDILQGLTNLGILKYLKLIEDNLGHIEIEPHHLQSVERICVVSKTTLDMTILADALLHLVSLHILCQYLQVIPGTPGIEITHMAGLKEVALHPDVQDNIRTTWEDAASVHGNRPNILLIEGP